MNVLLTGFVYGLVFTLVWYLVLALVHLTIVWFRDTKQ